MFLLWLGFSLFRQTCIPHANGWRGATRGPCQIDKLAAALEALKKGVRREPDRPTKKGVRREPDRPTKKGKHHATADHRAIGRGLPSTFAGNRRRLFPIQGR